MIEQIIIVALVVLSIWYTYQEGEIFGFVSVYGEKYIPEPLQQPLFACPICMTFWYGSAVYWLVWGNGWVEWLLVVISAMGVNVAINKLSPQK